MARLETQINQIFLNPSESKKLSLILFEEKLNANMQLFLLAELRGIQKKTEINDLNKISEIIISAFKEDQKLPGEAIFEPTLGKINDRLADFAHKGRKSWLGKFSALVALKSGNDFYMANSGYTAAWLKRKNSLNEILGPDKAETHPLKTFLNFSSGRLTDGDSLILATSSIFNYVSVELFSKTLNSNPLESSCAKISDILKSSARSDEGFAVFMLGLTKKTAVASEPAAEIPDSEAAAKTQAEEPGQTTAKKTRTKAQPEPATGPHSYAGPIYAPMPEDMHPEPAASPARLPKITLSLPKLPSLRLSAPSFKSFQFSSIRLPKFLQFSFLPSVSGPAKFFLGSFILFAVLFAMNIAAYGVRKAQSKQTEKFNSSAQVLVDALAEAESSLLYKNQSQAMKLMSNAESELHKLQQIDSKKAGPFQAKFEEMNNKINRVTVLRNLTPAFDMPYPVNFLSRAGNGYLVANENPNSLGTFTENELKSLFMLNKVDGDIRGIAHVSGQGNFVASKDKIYFANTSSQEFQQLSYISNADLSGVKFVDPNRLYAINKTANQVIRITVNASSASAAQNLLKVTVNLQEAQDLAVDNDIFVLFPNGVTKFTSTGQQATFQLGPLSEAATELKKIRIGNQIYLLEPIAKRVLIYSRAGELLNQVQFPELTDMRDLYVNETARELLIVNSNKVYRITF